MYVDIKKIFLSFTDYDFIVYLMAEHIVNNYTDFDALICTSKTGAVFANIVGQLIGKRVAYCVGVGPKFYVSIDDTNDAIKENDRFVFIFDFLCLGTEIKILNALLKRAKAYIIGGIGVASFLDLQSETLTDTIFHRINALLNVQETELGYKIAISQQKLIGG